MHVLNEVAAADRHGCLAGGGRNACITEHKLVAIAFPANRQAGKQQEAERVHEGTMAGARPALTDWSAPGVQCDAFHTNKCARAFAARDSICICRGQVSARFCTSVITCHKLLSSQLTMQQ